MDDDRNEERQRIRRTALMLAAIAVLFYLGSIATGVLRS